MGRFKISFFVLGRAEVLVSKQYESPQTSHQTSNNDNLTASYNSATIPATEPEVQTPNVTDKTRPESSVLSDRRPLSRKSLKTPRTPRKTQKPIAKNGTKSENIDISASLALRVGGRKYDNLKNLTYKIPHLATPRVLSPRPSITTPDVTKSEVFQIELSTSGLSDSLTKSFLIPNSCDNKHVDRYREKEQKISQNCAADFTVANMKLVNDKNYESIDVLKSQLKTEELQNCSAEIETEQEKNRRETSEKLTIENYKLDDSLDSFDEMPNSSRNFSWAQIRNCNSPLQLFTQFSNSLELAEILLTFKQLCNLCQVDSSACRTRTFKNLAPHLMSSKAFVHVARILGGKMKMTVYSKQNVCLAKNVVVIGAGPCGLRAAIECALLG